MPECDRLRRLQVREAWHHRAGMFGRAVDQGAHHVLDLPRKPVDRIAHPQAHIQRHLVVARPPGVQALAGIADRGRQPRLDVHVDVLERLVEGEVALLDARGDVRQAAADVGLVIGGDDPHMRQHRGMGERGSKPIEALIASMMAEGPSAKRPPHCRLALLLTCEGLSC